MFMSTFGYCVKRMKIHVPASSTLLMFTVVSLCSFNIVFRVHLSMAIHLQDVLEVSRY